jgi:hypothetical protein
MKQGRLSHGWVIVAVLAVAGFWNGSYDVTAQDQKFSYTPQGKRDPFVPLVSPAGYRINLEEEDESTVQLEGIMYDPKGDSMVIINGELVKVGESVAGAVVSQIEPSKVIVIKDNQRMELELRGEGY